MITNLEVKNYKSLADLRLNLGKTNVLIGPNNSGKSNILECLAFLSDIMRLTLSETFRKRGGYDHLVFGGQVDSCISIKISLTTKEIKTLYSVDIEKRGVTAENLEILKDNERFPLIEGKDGAGNFYDDSEKTQKGYSYSTDYTALSALRDLKRNRSIDGIRNEIDRWRFYNFDPFTMRHSDAVRRNFDPGQRGEFVPLTTHSLISEYLESFEDLEETLKSGIKEIDRLRAPLTDDGRTYVAIKEKDFESPFDYTQISDGTLRFLAHLLVLLAPQSKAPSLACFEEPENYIHPRLLQLLAQTMKQTKAQVIMTTHSPHLIDFIDLEDLVIVEKVDGKTVLKRPSKHELEKFLKNFSLGELWYSGKIGGVP